MMRLLTLNRSLILALLIFTHGISQAGEEVNQSLIADVDGVVEIENVRGQIKVVGWNKKQVQISGKLDDQAKELIFKTQGKTTLIHIKMPKNNNNRGSGSNLLIKIPKGSRMDFSGVSTDVEVINIAGGIDLRSVSGNVDVDNVKKQLSVNTVSGDINISNATGRAKLGTVSGDIEAKINSLDINTNSVSGDIQLDLLKINGLKATTVSGDIQISGQLNDSGKTRLSSVSGDIDLDFDSTLNARFNIETGSGGGIRNRLSDSKVENIFPNQQKLDMVIGDGSGSIKISTLSGTVTLGDKK